LGGSDAARFFCLDAKYGNFEEALATKDTKKHKAKQNLNCQIAPKNQLYSPVQASDVGVAVVRFLRVSSGPL
jgi:hypothetical protein